MEVFLRKTYWNNYRLLHKFNISKAIIPKEPFVWDEVLSYLLKIQLTKKRIIVLHSSYDSLKLSGLSPFEIINSLLTILGPDGTLAMPVIRRYAEEPNLEDFLNADFERIISTYDTRKSKIVTGLLPFCLTRTKDVVISRYPINSMAAVGKLAKSMMQNNIKEDFLAPCGKYSSWAYCVENDALIIGMGIDLVKNLTMMHVISDLFPERWPIKGWYRVRNFNIVDNEYRKSINVLERYDKWGCYYLTNENFRHDLLKNGILHTAVINNLRIEYLSSVDLFNFLLSRIETAYPYSIPRIFFKK